MVKFGVIGAGRIANVFATSMKVTSNGQLQAVASRNLKRAEDFKEKYGFEKAYGSYQALYEDSSVDCIYVATPHGLHYEQMMEILDYGKHILCEKPFTLNHKQAQAVFKKAKEKKLFVMEAMWTRFLPVIKAVKQKVDEGMIGTIKHLEATFHFNPEKNNEDRLFKRELGGGALLDIGIYPITFANLFLGRPNEVSSEVRMYKTGVDLEETITYHYDTAQAVLKASLDKEDKRDAVIIGSKGTIIVPRFWEAQKAMVYDTNNHLLETIEYKHEAAGFEYEIQEVINCIQNGKLESGIMPASETIEILKQMDNLRQSWGLTYPQEK